MVVRLLVGDAIAMLATLPDQSAHCCVTSPPYWRQRLYGDDPRELGRELTPEAWADGVVAVAREVRRVLVPDGSLWLNVGDKYAAGGMGGGGNHADRKNWQGTVGQGGWRTPPPGYKPKDLTLAPFVVADALRRDGWYLRQTIVWAKATAVEPPRLDRPSTSHEYLFLLGLSRDSRVRDPGESWWATSVWRIAASTDADHVAAMPVELARRCIVASSVEGDVVLDPFSGSGTTCMVADRLGRDAIGIDLSAEYVALGKARIVGDAPIFAVVSA